MSAPDPASRRIPEELPEIRLRAAATVPPIRLPVPLTTRMLGPDDPALERGSVGSRAEVVALDDVPAGQDSQSEVSRAVEDDASHDAGVRGKRHEGSVRRPGDLDSSRGLGCSVDGRRGGQSRQRWSRDCRDAGPGNGERDDVGGRARVGFLDGRTQRAIAVDVLAEAVARSRVGEIGGHVDHERRCHSRRGDRNRAVRREDDLARRRVCPDADRERCGRVGRQPLRAAWRERFRGAIELFPRFGVFALPVVAAFFLEKVDAAVLAKERDFSPRRIREGPDGDRGRGRRQGDRRRRAGNRSRCALQDHRAAAGIAAHRRDEVGKTVADADVAGRERREKAW